MGTRSLTYVYDGEKPIACIKVELDFEEGDGL